MEQLQADDQCENSADQEERQHREEIHDADALMIQRGQPGPDSLGVIQIIVAVCGIRMCHSVPSLFTSNS